MATYKVTGRLPFDGHQPGSQFTADLRLGEERRAIRRGLIQVIKPGLVELDPNTVTPPKQRRTRRKPTKED